MLLAYLLFLIFFLILGVIFIIVFAVQLIAIFTSQVPFVSVPKSIQKEINRNINLKNGDVLYDLGCGDARVLLEVVKTNPEIKAMGVEVAFLPYWIAKFKTRKHKNIKILREDIFKTNIKDATHIFMYLSTKAVNKLYPIIKKQCKSGTIIMSCDFELENIEPSKVIDLENISQNKLRGQKLFVYTV